jgi:RNA polymerase I-specific transcription initiation factor RRN6
MLYRLAEGENGSSIVELGMTRQSEWILDVQRSTQNVPHFYVLTTSRLLWFDLTTATSNEYGSRTALRPRLTWRHFRDPEDTTLRMSDLLIDGGMRMILYMTVDLNIC